MGNFILTYDIGTTGNKCTIFDTGGKALYTETAAYGTIYPKPGWSEQKPRDFWDSVVSGTRALLKKSGINPSAISVIGISGHMNGCLPVDREGNVLFNDIIHSDSRSISECADISKVIDDKDYYNLTGSRLDPHFTLSKVLWLKKNYPDVYKNTAFFIGSKDYVSYKLTGNLGVTDYSDASMTGMLDINKKEWALGLLRALDVDINKMPKLLKSHDIAGYVTSDTAAELGLVKGTPVVSGGGDGACATKGAGVAKKYEAYNYIGSSSWISVLNDSPILDADARIFNFYDLDGESCNVCGTIQCAASSYDWVLENIAKHEACEALRNNVNVFDHIDEIAKKVPAGSNGVFFLPYLMGERSPLWDENTKGGFVGFTLYNSNRDLIRAAYEGIAYALKSVLDVFEENGLVIDKLNLIGGGAKSPLWNEIMCNIYSKRIFVHRNPREATSLGAAIAAGVGAGIYRDYAGAVKVVEFERGLEPERSLVEKYKKFYSVYKMMYPRLKPIYDEISRLQDME